MGKSVCVIGAGPCGLEIAVAAVRQGYKVTVLEVGEVAASMKLWGHVTLFSPTKLNVSPGGREVLQEMGKPLSDEEGEQFITGGSFRERYLLTLAEWLQKKDCTIRCNTQVVSVGRGMLGKAADIMGAKGVRGSTPFRLLVRSGEREEHLTFDAVVDASGSYRTHGWMGPGGIPAIGETAAADAIHYQIPNVADGDAFRGKTALVVGTGASAVTTIAALRKLSADGPINVVWLTRREGLPYVVIPDDPLPQRRELYKLGNDIAEGKVGDTSNFSIRHRSGAHVLGIEGGKGGYTVSVGDSSGAVVETVRCDNICAHVGFRPDMAITRELQVHYCFATEGPMKLAAAMLAASGDAGGDCLKQVVPGADTLVSPEPGFYVVGMKSVGRGSTYLMRTGVEQVGHVMELLQREGDSTVGTQ